MINIVLLWEKYVFASSQLFLGITIIFTFSDDFILLTQTFVVKKKNFDSISLHVSSRTITVLSSDFLTIKVAKVTYL